MQMRKPPSAASYSMRRMMILGIGIIITLNVSLEDFIRRVIFIFLNGSSLFMICLIVFVKPRTMSSISLRTCLGLFVYCFLKSKEKEMSFLFVVIVHKLMECLYSSFGVWV